MLQIAPEERVILQKVARRSLELALGMDTGPAPSELPPTLSSQLACFVSLKTASGRLRGCIGCLESLEPLHRGVARFARRAAFEDPRFRPVTREELTSLRIDIHVLGPLLPLRAIEELVIGRHGLEVANGIQRGVLLAKVASDMNWDAKRFRIETCVKAGLDPLHLDRYRFSYFEEVSFGETG